MTYVCCSCEHEFDTPGSRCYRGQSPKSCVHRDVHRGRGECSCDDCCPECGSDDFEETESEED